MKLRKKTFFLKKIPRENSAQSNGRKESPKKREKLRLRVKKDKEKEKNEKKREKKNLSFPRTKNESLLVADSQFLREKEEKEKG